MFVFTVEWTMADNGVDTGAVVDFPAASAMHAVNEVHMAYGHLVQRTATGARVYQVKQPNGDVAEIVFR
jgi:hypothetical protein